MILGILKMKTVGNSQEVQRSGLCTFTAQGLGFHPWSGNQNTIGCVAWINKQKEQTNERNPVVGMFVLCSAIGWKKRFL